MMNIFGLLGIIFILLTKVEIVSSMYNNKINAHIRIAKIIKININYIKWIKAFITRKDDRNKLSLVEIVENLHKLKLSYPFLRNFCRYSFLKELKIINNYKELNPYVSVTNYNLYSYVSMYVNELFGKVEYEKYDILYEKKNSLEFECIISTRFVNIIIVIMNNLFNMRRVIKIIKIGGKHGTSNT